MAYSSAWKLHPLFPEHLPSAVCGLADAGTWCGRRGNDCYRWKSHCVRRNYVVVMHAPDAVLSRIVQEKRDDKC